MDNTPGQGLYTGWREVYVSGGEIDRLYHDGAIEMVLEPSLAPNEFVILKATDDPQHSALARREPKRPHVVIPLRYADSRPWNISPLNAPQRMLLELLMDPQVMLVASPSRAGTGKNVLAFAAGLEQVNRGLYDKVVVYKSLVPVNRELGFLPGELDEKLGPYHDSSLDTLLFLASKNGSKNAAARARAYLDSGMIELSTFTFLRGTNLPRRFIIIDEAQNVDAGILKTALTRAAEGTKVVVLGHPGQIDARGLSPRSCGISRLVYRFKGQEIFGSVTLTDCVRSELARLADELL